MHVPVTNVAWWDTRPIGCHETCLFVVGDGGGVSSVGPEVSLRKRCATAPLVCPVVPSFLSFFRRHRLSLAVFWKATVLSVAN